DGFRDEGRRRQVALSDPERDQPLPAAAVVEHFHNAAGRNPAHRGTDFREPVAFGGQERAHATRVMRERAARGKRRSAVSRPAPWPAGGPLAMPPRLVWTTQAPPRLSMRKTRPAPGMKSPVVTACGPYRLSTTAIPLRTSSTAYSRSKDELSDLGISF